MSGSDLRTCRNDGSAGGGHGDGGVMRAGGRELTGGDDVFCDGEGYMLAVGVMGAAIRGGTLLAGLMGDLPFLVVLPQSTDIVRNLRKDGLSEHDERQRRERECIDLTRRQDSPARKGSVT